MSELLRALVENESELRAAFNHATTLSAHEAEARSRPNRPQEPDFIAMLVLGGVPVFAKALHHLLSRYGLHTLVSSVFCHQRPMVEFGTKNRCELGDLLLVHRHKNSSGTTERNSALLLQAKISRDLLTTVTSADRAQLDLYTLWPTFRYFRSGSALSNQSRSVKPKQRHSGAQYLLINDAGLQSLGSGAFGISGTHAMAVWHADQVLCAKLSFADEFLRFLQGSSGRLFHDFGNPDPSGWSEVVWDLLTYGVSHAFNRRRSGVEGTSRFSGDVRWLEGRGVSFARGDEVCGVASEGQSDFVREHFERFFTSGDQPPHCHELAQRSDPGDSGGVSVILVETAVAG